MNLFRDQESSIEYGQLFFGCRGTCVYEAGTVTSNAAAGITSSSKRRASNPQEISSFSKGFDDSVSNDYGQTARSLSVISYLAKQRARS